MPRIKQLSLFDAPAYAKPVEPVPPCDPSVAMEPRLSGQNLAVLERLRRGPATNRELSEIALKYTSRISDLRAVGFRIACFEEREAGLATYRLEHEA